MSLSNRDAIANVAVKDLEVAKRFYSEKLGLKQVDGQGDEVAIFSSGKTTLNVYRSKFAGTNQATAVTWSVDDAEIERMVRELKDKGIRFEHYEMPGLELKGDLHVAEGMKVAWFKDPDGNILNLVSA